MLFRCFSWEHSDDEVIANDIAKESFALNCSQLDANRKTFPSGDLIFCRFSFSRSLCIIKSRRIVSRGKRNRWICTNEEEKNEKTKRKKEICCLQVDGTEKGERNEGKGKEEKSL
jgi:hypothetical protein